MFVHFSFPGQGILVSTRDAERRKVRRGRAFRFKTCPLLRRKTRPSLHKHQSPERQQISVEPGVLVRELQQLTCSEKQPQAALPLVRTALPCGWAQHIQKQTLGSFTFFQFGKESRIHKGALL